jgi:hypothetical protein
MYIPFQQGRCCHRSTVYGNPLTVVASFLGIAAEEVSPQELDAWHPEYPVATCLVATK